jgi:hypothetical protein
MALPATTERVALHTRPVDTDRLRHELELRVAYYAEHPDEIETRLRELDREWDLERTLTAGAGVLCLVGLVLGMTAGRRWLALPAVAGGFLVAHSLQGTTPASLRGRGRRTASEIDAERYALKALRGDFDALGSAPADQRAGRALAAARS